MQFRFLASLIIFIGSYLPLGLILLAQDFRYELLAAPVCWPLDGATCVLPLRNGVFPVAIFTTCVVCFLISLGALAVVHPKNPIDVIEVKHVPAELMSYTLPYVVTFMSLEYQETGKFVGLTIFLAWMFLITYRSGQLILNPFLAVFGWRLYEIKYRFPSDATERSGRVLSKVIIEHHERYHQSSLQDVMLIKSNHHEGGH